MSFWQNIHENAISKCIGINRRAKLLQQNNVEIYVGVPPKKQPIQKKTKLLQ